MAKYRVLKQSFINDRIVEAGTVVEYAGIPHRSNLAPIDEEGRQMAAQQDDAADLLQQQAAASAFDLNLGTAAPTPSN
jgi:hypothetical protein